MLVKGDPPHPGKHHKTVVLTTNNNCFDKTSRNLSNSVEEQWNCAHLTGSRKTTYDPTTQQRNFFENRQKCVLNSVWYREIPLKFSLEKVNPFAWNGVANFGHSGHVCARFCFKRTVRHTVLCIWGWRELLSGTEILQKRSLRKAALVREKFPNFCDKTKLPTQ